MSTQAIPVKGGNGAAPAAKPDAHAELEAARAQLAMLQARQAELEAENAKLQASRVQSIGFVVYADCEAKTAAKSGQGTVGCRCTKQADGRYTCPHGRGPKGNIGLTGFGRYPVVLYTSQWERVLALPQEFRAMVAAVNSQAPRK